MEFSEEPTFYTIRLISEDGFFAVISDGKRIPYFHSQGFSDSGKKHWDLGVESFTETEKSVFKTLFMAIESDIVIPQYQRNYACLINSKMLLSLVESYIFLVSNTTEKVKETLQYIFSTDIIMFKEKITDLKKKCEFQIKYRPPFFNKSPNKRYSVRRPQE